MADLSSERLLHTIAVSFVLAASRLEKLSEAVSLREETEAAKD